MGGEKEGYSDQWSYHQRDIQTPHLHAQAIIMGEVQKNTKWNMAKEKLFFWNLLTGEIKKCNNSWKEQMYWWKQEKSTKYVRSDHSIRGISRITTSACADYMGKKWNQFYFFMPNYQSLKFADFIGEKKSLQWSCHQRDLQNPHICIPSLSGKLLMMIVYQTNIFMKTNVHPAMTINQSYQSMPQGPCGWWSVYKCTMSPFLNFRNIEDFSLRRILYSNTNIHG